MRRRIQNLLIVALSAMLISAGCTQQRNSTDETNAPVREVTVYVSTDRVFSEPILRAYEQQSRIRVNAVYDTEETKSTGLANKLLAEKNRPQADVFWSNEPVRTLVLKRNGVLAPYKSPNAEGIPETFKDPDG
ncbi:MAG: iron transporter, partial [Acidobacteria bacterium]|nr:iron transporter [Acidobacteriota bacterium]